MSYLLKLLLLSFLFFAGLFFVGIVSPIFGQASKSINVNLEVTEESSCGDGICNGGETCATCPADCTIGCGGPGESHNECNAQKQCISVSGSGTNQCNTNNDCNVCDPHGDLNKDGSINIVDFSILMYFWQQTNPSNPCADINKDGIVNLTDFSIMLYWWTG